MVKVGDTVRIKNPQLEEQGELSAPEIAFENYEGYLSVNSSKQLQMVTHAAQQLAFEHDRTIELAQSNETKIHQLQRELNKANQRIKELESA